MEKANNYIIVNVVYHRPTHFAPLPLQTAKSPPKRLESIEANRNRSSYLFLRPLDRKKRVMNLVSGSGEKVRRSIVLRRSMVNYVICRNTYGGSIS
jgi:hypothetical protein